MLVSPIGAAEVAPDWRGLEPPRHLVMFGPRSLQTALERAGCERIDLLLPPPDAAFYIEQSENVRGQREPFEPHRPTRRAARWEGRAWDADAFGRPELAESVTMIGFRPA